MTERTSSFKLHESDTGMLASRYPFSLARDLYLDRRRRPRHLPHGASSAVRQGAVLSVDLLIDKAVGVFRIGKSPGSCS